MAPSSRTGAKHPLPHRRGIVLWLMVALSIAAGALVAALLLVLLGIPRTGAGWLWTVGLIVLGMWIGFVVLSIGQRSSDGFTTGTAQADAARGDRFEATGRRAGRAVGRGIATMTNRGSTNTTSDDARTDAPPSDRPSLDDAARSLGKMVGRRIGGRTKDQP